MSRVPLTTAWIRLPGTPIACASPVLAHANLLEEFFFQNLTGMGIANLSHDHILLFTTRGSVVVHDLDIRSVPIEPSKADTPLIVDPNAHLSCPIPLQ